MKVFYRLPPGPSVLFLRENTMLLLIVLHTLKTWESRINVVYILFQSVVSK